MDAEGRWELARETAYQKSLLCKLTWHDEAARERRRQRQRKRSHDFKAASPFGGHIAVLVVDEFEDDLDQPGSPRNVTTSNSSKTNVSDIGTGSIFQTSVGTAETAAATLLKRQSTAMDGYFGDEDLEGDLRVFTSTGDLVFSKPWYEGNLAPGGFGWSQGGVLVCVLAAGDTVEVFRVDQGGAPRMFSIPTQGNRRIACAHVWAGGFVAITEDLEIVEGYHLDDPLLAIISVRARLSPVLIGGEHANAPHAISVLRPFVSREDPGMATIVVANPSSAGMIAIESDGIVRSQFALSHDVSKSKWLVPHPTYRLLASYGEDGVLSVLPMDFCQVLVRHDCTLISTPGMRPPSPASVRWCGLATFAICITWPEAPWSGPQHTGVLLLSMEHEFEMLSAAHLRGSSALEENQENRSLQTDPERAAQFDFPPGCRAFEEADGIRLVGGEYAWLLRQVPECYRRLFGLGSTDPGAMLIETVEMLDGGDANADGGLRSLVDSDMVIDAVNTCLDAAEHATGASEAQIFLLRAASYGKRFVPASASGRTSLKERRTLARRFVEVCRLVRLCNAAREEAGIALTTKELRVMTPRVLIDRLLFMGKFHLASKLCRLAGVSTSHVVTQWAAAKIRASPLEDDEDSAAAAGRSINKRANGRSDAAAGKTSSSSSSTNQGGNAEKGTSGGNSRASNRLDALIEAISTRVETCRRKDGTMVAYATLAAVAASEGRVELARRLSDRETHLSRRVLLLLRLDDFEGALRTIATETGGDPDLHMFTISRCTQMIPIERIISLAAESPRLRELFTLFFRSTDQDMYKRLLLGLDAKKEKAFVLANESCMALRAEERAKLVTEASQELLASGQRGLSSLAADHARLVRRQNELGESLVGLSLADTILDCFRRGLDDEAEAFAKDFNFPEKTYRKTQLRGLAARKAWLRVEELSSQAAVRAVLDDADFAEVCLAGGQYEEAARYARCLEDSSEAKAPLLLRVSLFDEAMDAAFKIGNTRVLEAVRRRDPSLDSSVREKLEHLAKNGPSIKTVAATKDRAPLAALNAARDKAAQGCAQQ